MLLDEDVRVVVVEVALEVATGLGFAPVESLLVLRLPVVELSFFKELFSFVPFLTGWVATEILLAFA